jgi:hypothetical protein
MSTRHEWDRQQLAQILLNKRIVHSNEGMIIMGEWSECWLWPSAGKPPYGVIKISGRSWPVHRVSIWVFKRDTRARLTGREFHARHRCNNPRCIRPEHLLMGTGRENRDDYLRSKTDPEFCVHGHELTIKNRYRKSGTRQNYCRECHRLRQQSRVRKFKELGLNHLGKPFIRPWRVKQNGAESKAENHCTA